MSQVDGVGELGQVVGYVLKQAATVLRAAMDTALRPLDLTVPQYACLELLHQRPGASNADLARAAFVSRQSMNLVLRGLQDRGLVARPAVAPEGRVLPTRLTAAGRRLQQRASAVVREVEVRMLTSLGPVQQRRLLESLRACIGALGPVPAAEERLDG